MKRALRLLILLTLPLVAFCQDGYTTGAINGRFWVSLSLAASKRSFLLGFREGLKFGTVQFVECGLDKVKMALAISWPSSMSSDELMAAVDRFYENPLNRPIPFGRALMYIEAEATGMKAAQLADILADFRRDAISDPKQ
jgi:hypothetical protein